MIKPNYIYFTYFDSRYLPRGIALLQSLRESHMESEIIILCLDSVCYSYLKSMCLKRVTLIRLEHLENADVELKASKQNRTIIEYYFTLTSCLANYIASHLVSSDDTLLCYVDSDLYFYSAPDKIFDFAKDANIIITPHDFPEHLLHLKRHGLYNVGFIAWRLNQVGRTCIADYRKDCLEWCKDLVDGHRYADQGYLSSWPVRYKRVCSLEKVPINISYWNIGSYLIEYSDGIFYLNGHKLIAWHFSGLVTRDYLHFDLKHRPEEILGRPDIVQKIYTPYINILKSINSKFIYRAGSICQAPIRNV